MPNDPGRKPVVHTRKHIARLQRERQQTRLILYTFVGIVAAVVGLIVYGYLDLNYLQLRRPVAKVGDEEILASQFEARVRLYRQQLLNQYQQMQYYQAFGLDVSAQLQQIETTLNSPVGIGQTVLDRMIEEELVKQEAAKRGIVVSDEEIDREIQINFQYFPNGTLTPTATPTEVIMPTIPAQAFEIVTMTPTPTATPEFTPTLEATPTPEAEGTSTLLPASTGTVEPLPSPTPTATFTATASPTLTPTAGPTSTPFPTATPYTFEGFQSEYKDVLGLFNELGMSEADYRSLVEYQILYPKLFDQITADVPREEEQVWARHILVPDEASAYAVLERLILEDFASVAREVSQDTASAANGGDLGWFGKGVMVAPFEDAAFKLQPGEISDPVKSDFGYHIIQVIAKQVRPLDASQYEQARNKAYQAWLTKAKEEYGVQTFDFWMERVPTDPNFITMATKSAENATAQAKNASPAP